MGEWDARGRKGAHGWGADRRGYAPLQAGGRVPGPLEAVARSADRLLGEQPHDCWPRTAHKREVRARIARLFERVGDLWAQRHGSRLQVVVHELRSHYLALTAYERGAQLQAAALELLERARQAEPVGLCVDGSRRELCGERQNEQRELCAWGRQLF